MCENWKDNESWSERLVMGNLNNKEEAYKEVYETLEIFMNTVIIEIQKRIEKGE